jgi:hypothetical protein
MLPDLRDERLEAAGVVAGAAMYATARYHVFNNVAWSDWPIYTMNKVFGLSALVLLVLAVARRRWRPELPIGGTMLSAGVLFGMHVLVSLALLSPAYYPKMFAGGKLSAPAGTALVLGAIATAALAAGAKPRPQQHADTKARGLALLAFALGAHGALPGVASWLEPSAWPGLMPPISLVSFVLGAAALGIAWTWQWPPFAHRISSIFVKEKPQ